MNEATKKMIAEIAWAYNYHSDKLKDAKQQLDSLSLISSEAAEMILNELRSGKTV